MLSKRYVSGTRAMKKAVINSSIDFNTHCLQILYWIAEMKHNHDFALSNEPETKQETFR